MTVVLDRESMVYPRHLLPGCESALLLFCSGRMGAADGHWVREAGLTDVTALDWDQTTLGPFQAEYPDEWRYVCSDAFAWSPSPPRSWDLVSADVPSQWWERVPDGLPHWCSLSNRYVTVTVGDKIPDPPDGWATVGLVWRSEWQWRNYHWLILERQ